MSTRRRIKWVSHYVTSLGNAPAVVGITLLWQLFGSYAGCKRLGDAECREIDCRANAFLMWQGGLCRLPRACMWRCSEVGFRLYAEV